MSTSTSEDDASLPDPRYQEWDEKARVELRQRLCDGMHKRQERTVELIAKTIDQELKMLGVDERSLSRLHRRYSVSNDVEQKTRQAIDAQIRSWKGLRWRRFNEKGCRSWSEWLKKAKCWQDQNSFAPMGVFWCLILDELQTYTRMLSQQICAQMSSHEDQLQLSRSRMQRAMHQCLFAKCIESILSANVRFERTRQTPLLPVRALSESKDLHTKLASIDKGFTLCVWKAESTTSTSPAKQRSKTAALLNAKCSQHCRSLYQSAIGTLGELMPRLDMRANNSAAKPMLNNENEMSCVVRLDDVDGHDVNSHSDSEGNANTTIASLTNSVPLESPSDEIDQVISSPMRNHYATTSNQYGPTRGVNPMFRSELHRFSPMSAAPNTHPYFATDTCTASLTDTLSNNSNSTFSSASHNNISSHEDTTDNADQRLRLHRLKLENARLKAQLADVQHKLLLQAPAPTDTDQLSVLRAMIRQMERQNQFQHYLLMQHMGRSNSSVVTASAPPTTPDVIMPTYSHGAPMSPSHSQFLPPPVPLSSSSSALLNDNARDTHNLYHYPAESYIQPMMHDGSVNVAHAPPMAVASRSDDGRFARVQPHFDEYSCSDQQQNAFQYRGVAPGQWDNFTPTLASLPSVYNGEEQFMPAPPPAYGMSDFSQYPR